MTEPEGDGATNRNHSDARSRGIADGYLPAEIEDPSDEDLASLLDYEDGSTMEACAERLSKMMVWRPDTSAEKIAAVLAQRSTADQPGNGIMNQSRCRGEDLDLLSDPQTD